MLGVAPLELVAGFVRQSTLALHSPISQGVLACWFAIKHWSAANKNHAYSLSSGLPSPQLCNLMARGRDRKKEAENEVNREKEKNEKKGRRKKRTGEKEQERKRGKDKIEKREGEKEKDREWGERGPRLGEPL